MYVCVVIVNDKKNSKIVTCKKFKEKKQDFDN